MKTADLIPLILLELNQMDMYGFELTKSIETKTDGKILIKQPTLYTILKKLEKSKFITSYWQDSDIGGKRHYYKLTENGRIQVSTLPSFDALVKIALENEEANNQETKDSTINTSADLDNTNFNTLSSVSENATSMENANLKDVDVESVILENTEVENVNLNNDFIETRLDNTSTSADIDTENDIKQSGNSQTNKIGSIFDMLPVEEETKEAIIPTKEIFKEDSIDTNTDLEINKNNISLLKEEKTAKEESFANNEKVAKFTEKTTKISDQDKQKIIENTVEMSDEIFENTKSNTSYSNDDIKSVDYINFSQDKNYIYSNKINEKLILRIMLNCSYLLLWLTISSLFTVKATIFYLVLVFASVCVIIFVPLIFFLNKRKLILKYRKEKYKTDIKKHLIIALSIMLASIILALTISICSGVNSLGKIFSVDNFYNFYAIILLFAAPLIDVLIDYLLFVKFNNLEK